MLHSGGTQGGAECWFHEAAVWDAALNAGGIASVVAYQARWILGPRKGIQVLVTGQSNAGNGLNDGAWHLMAQGVAWHLGALAYGVVAVQPATRRRPPPASTWRGHLSRPLPWASCGLFLANPGDGSDPSTWSLGSDGNAVQTWVQSRTAAEDAADDRGDQFWPWSESDCRPASTAVVIGDL